MVDNESVWRYCPSVMNPADPLSRGISMTELIKSRWCAGPTWLRSKEEWPQTSSDTFLFKGKNTMINDNDCNHLFKKPDTTNY